MARYLLPREIHLWYSEVFLAMWLLWISLLLGSFSSLAWASFPDEGLTAPSALLMDADTGQVFYQRGPDLPLPPASTTKVLTAIVVLENKKLTDRLTVSKSATHVRGTRVRLRPGQVMSVHDLLYSLLLTSANDASLVLAEGVAGSVARFAEMMTLKARDIGATNSHFTNPHGLTEPGHYSTARDMALIFNYAMSNPDFREIIQTQTRSVSISAVKGRRVRYITVRNHNRLLGRFDGATGGKTGYTYAARKCFVGGAYRDGVSLIVSLLGSRNLWGDSRRLLEYGFQNYAILRVAPVLSAPPSSSLSGKDEAKTGANGHVLQIASFRERERAEALTEKLLEMGFQVSVEEATHQDNGDITYRVRVGPFSQLPQAQEAAREIEQRSGFKALILPAAAEEESS